MLVAIFLQILYRNSYWICHLTAKGKDKTGLGISHSVLNDNNILNNSSYTFQIYIVCHVFTAFDTSFGIIGWDNPVPTTTNRTPSSQSDPLSNRRAARGRPPVQTSRDQPPKQTSTRSRASPGTRGAKRGPAPTVTVRRSRSTHQLDDANAPGAPSSPSSLSPADQRTLTRRGKNLGITTAAARSSSQPPRYSLWLWMQTWTNKRYAA
jgi:hypothetical protein